MLKLLAFLPCEKIIVSEDGLVTLANVLDRVNVEPQEKQEVPQNGAVAMVWEVFTLWRNIDHAEDGKGYEQRVEFYRPDDTLAFTVSNKFEVKEFSNIRTIGKVGAFPVGVTGTAWLRLSLRDAGAEEWKSITDYPVQITHDSDDKAKAELVQSEQIEHAV